MSYKKILLLTAGMAAIAGAGGSVSITAGNAGAGRKRVRLPNPKPQLKVTELPKGCYTTTVSMKFEKHNAVIMVSVEVYGGTEKATYKNLLKLQKQLDIYLSNTPLVELELDKDFIITKNEKQIT